MCPYVNGMCPYVNGKCPYVKANAYSDFELPVFDNSSKVEGPICYRRVVCYSSSKLRGLSPEYGGSIFPRNVRTLLQRLKTLS
jgi:hypothetical protein